jgi:hypothetical protein
MLVSLIVAIIPIIVLIIALLINNLWLLNYVHVITGGSWTGIDIFMGVLMTRIMLSLNIEARIEMAIGLTPAMVFFMPSLASVAITAGYFLANKIGYFNINSPWIIAAGIVVIILSVQGFGILLPNEVRIFLELNKEKPDNNKIVKLNNINLKLAGSQAIFQLIIILIMARIALFGV